jgi:hypothetical protein
LKKSYLLWHQFGIVVIALDCREVKSWFNR